MVSSPWMPPVCPHCRDVGHTLKRCKLAPVLCSLCNSTTHDIEKCQQQSASMSNTTQSRRGKAKQKSEIPSSNTLEEKGVQMQSSTSTLLHPGQSALGTASDITKGESSSWIVVKKRKDTSKAQDLSVSHSEVDSDSSDIKSCDSQKGTEASLDHHGYDRASVFRVPKNQKNKKKGIRGKGPKPT
ncbi:hypothetical protein AALP_AA3G181600 [Arabis alpina]|uniref:Uncharacterized protein n=1 Tax=Arabis alpina TaxID=50452 RepID=A0A087HA02_ARAAL|nr:hypothetical protein AALP_AA3G181600 [Arabis alpina]